MLHWQGVVTSACEQSGRAVVPEVQSPLSLPEWLAGADFPLALILDPLAADRLSGASPGGGSVAVLVGPEGGFTEEELKTACDKGVRAVSMGPRVLRTETAGPAAIAVLQARAGDF